MSHFVVILPRVLDADEVVELVRTGMTVSTTPSATGLRAIHVSAGDGRAALDRVLSRISLTAWEAHGVSVLPGGVNRTGHDDSSPSG